MDRNLVDEVVRELANRGYPDARPSREHAMRAISAGADSASDLARRLAVSKQAAAKTIAVLVERGYVTTEADPADVRRKIIRITDRGSGLLREGAAIFDEVRARWEDRLGAANLARLEAQLALPSRRRRDVRAGGEAQGTNVPAPRGDDLAAVGS